MCGRALATWRSWLCVLRSRMVARPVGTSLPWHGTFNVVLVAARAAAVARVCCASCRHRIPSSSVRSWTWAPLAPLRRRAPRTPRHRRRRAPGRQARRRRARKRDPRGRRAPPRRPPKRRARRSRGSRRPRRKSRARRRRSPPPQAGSQEAEGDLPPTQEVPEQGGEPASASGSGQPSLLPFLGKPKGTAAKSKASGSRSRLPSRRRAAWIGSCSTLLAVVAQHGLELAASCRHSSHNGHACCFGASQRASERICQATSAADGNAKKRRAPSTVLLAAVVAARSTSRGRCNIRLPEVFAACANRRLPQTSGCKARSEVCFTLREAPPCCAQRSHASGPAGSCLAVSASG